MHFNFERYRKLRHYRAVRRQLEELSEQDLLDAGIRRYQLGHIARVKALKPAQS
jgi:uncharacterized protein YjiS (DUF1127 family)